MLDILCSTLADDIVWGDDGMPWGFPCGDSLSHLQSIYPGDLG